MSVILKNLISCLQLSTPVHVEQVTEDRHTSVHVLVNDRAERENREDPVDSALSMRCTEHGSGTPRALF